MRSRSRSAWATETGWRVPTTISRRPSRSRAGTVTGLPRARASPAVPHHSTGGWSVGGGVGEMRKVIRGLGIADRHARLDRRFAAAEHPDRDVTPGERPGEIDVDRSPPRPSPARSGGRRG